MRWKMERGAPRRPRAEICARGHRGDADGRQVTPEAGDPLAADACAGGAARAGGGAEAAGAVVAGTVPRICAFCFLPLVPRACLVASALVPWAVLLLTLRAADGAARDVVSGRRGRDAGAHASHVARRGHTVVAGLAEVEVHRPCLGVRLGAVLAADRASVDCARADPLTATTRATVGDVQRCEAPSLSAGMGKSATRSPCGKRLVCSPTPRLPALAVSPELTAHAARLPLVVEASPMGLRD
jgi:hypothetical protein